MFSISTRRLSLVGAVLLAVTVCVSAQAAQTAKKLTVYAVPSTAQFMNHADDRLRGMSTNPFNVKTQALVIVTKGAEKGNGPFPGDDILYTFKLYGDSKLSKQIGSAIFTCYYNFVKRATCDSYFDLNERPRARLGAGRVQRQALHPQRHGRHEQLPRRARRGSSRSRRQELGTSRPETPRLEMTRLEVTRRTVQPWCATAVAALALLGIGAAAGSAQAAAPQSLTIYARATQAQYINHSDDRVRGTAKNPFNVDAKNIPPTKESGTGTQTGDEARYGFKLYSDAALKKLIGTATYSCRFTHPKQALCEADFQLNDGAMFGSGPASFTTTTLTFVVSGGSGRYLGARGQVSSAPVAAKDAHRLVFTLR